MQVEAVRHRGHDIKAAMRGSEAEAVVFRDKAIVLRTAAPIVPGAIEHAKSLLEGLLRDRFQPRRRMSTTESEGDVGIVEEYAEALAVLPLNQREQAMLVAHAKAPNRILTAQQLADAGRGEGTSHSSADSHYGKLGGRFADYLELKLPTYGGGMQLKTCALAESIDGTGELGSAAWRWRMHEELAVALKTLGMI